VVVAFEHIAGNVTGNRHNGLFARLTLCQLGNRGVVKIMKAQTRERIPEPLDTGLALFVPAGFLGLLVLPAGWALNYGGNEAPGGAPTVLRARGVNPAILTVRENVMLLLRIRETGSPAHQLVKAA
jgi:hypothetical protein